MDFQTFLQQFVNALSLGSLYALIAIGYTMVYGILRLINFAHGDIFMVGGYLAFYGVSLLAMPWWAAILVATLLTPLLFWFWVRDPQAASLMAILTVLLWFMHRENIARLLAGNEGKIGQKG